LCQPGSLPQHQLNQGYQPVRAPGVLRDYRRGPSATAAQNALSESDTKFYAQAALGDGAANRSRAQTAIWAVKFRVAHGEEAGPTQRALCGNIVSDYSHKGRCGIAYDMTMVFWVVVTDPATAEVLRRRPCGSLRAAEDHCETMKQGYPLYRVEIKPLPRGQFPQ
jgi:hypothetical protein